MQAGELAEHVGINKFLYLEHKHDTQSLLATIKI